MVEAKPVDRTSELKRKLRNSWIHGHESYRQAKKEYEEAEDAISNVEWDEDPSTYVSNVQAAGERYERAQQDLADVEEELAKVYNRAVGIRD